MNQNKIFKDKKLDIAFNEQGYVVIDWLDSVGVQKLKGFCETNGLNKVDGFSNAMNYSEVDISFNSHELICNAYSESISKYFFDFEPVIGSFVVKGRGEHGKISLHQDWSIVDEKESFSVNIWCALEKITFKNGCMAVLPKSHKQPFSVRGSLVNNIWSEANPPSIYEFWLSNYKIKYIYLKPGQALIYNQKLVHFSTENLSKKSRLAAGLLIVPKMQQLIHYQFKNDRYISKFNVDKNFFFQKNILEIDLNIYKKTETIILKLQQDKVFDQVKEKVFPDDKGVVNFIRKIFFKSIQI